MLVDCDTCTAAMQYLATGASRKLISRFRLPALFSHSRKDPESALKARSSDHKDLLDGLSMHAESKNRQNNPSLTANCRRTAASGIGELSPIMMPSLPNAFNTDSVLATTMLWISDRVLTRRGSESSGRHGFFCGQHGLAERMDKRIPAPSRDINKYSLSDGRRWRN